jgi:YesN/AraC family two-component response regulator
MNDYSFLISVAVNEIHERYSEIFGVEELAESLMVNKSYLIRRFKAETGVSPGRYLQGIRIDHAKEFLLNPEYSTEVIAVFCGYSCANYFCKVFKKETGETPTEYRQRSATNHKHSKPLNEEELEIYLL